MNKFNNIQNDFPIFLQKRNNLPLIFFDNASTTQKPLSVIKALDEYYSTLNANVHRGTYQLTAESTHLYEAARRKIQHYIGASHPSECIFVRGTTEAINLVANSFTHHILKPDDEIIITEMEHHSNIVPWQVACERAQAKLRVLSCDEKGEVSLSQFKNLLNEKTKLVAICHISNVLGTINPIHLFAELAHHNGTPILIDGAQAAGHIPINVQELDCDFYAFSGHKMYGPTGIGILYGKQKWLDALPPYQTGGEMIRRVTFSKTEYNKLPYKFEAGTPAIAEAIALGVGVDFLTEYGLEHIEKHEHQLSNYALEHIYNIPEVTIIGNAQKKAPIISFHINQIHPHDLSTYLDEHGIALRAGQLCAEPLLARFGVKSLLRASLGLYNTQKEIEFFSEQLKNAIRFFKR